jgi:hypothetical protein
MSTAGLSKSRLERMHRVLSGYVERQDMPGLVALVGHHDDVHVETLGTLSFGHPTPMKRDTIFPTIRRTAHGTPSRRPSRAGAGSSRRSTTISPSAA